MSTPVELMRKHLEFLKRERKRTIEEIETLQHGLIDIDKTIENLESTVGKRVGNSDFNTDTE